MILLTAMSIENGIRAIQTGAQAVQKFGSNVFHNNAEALMHEYGGKWGKHWAAMDKLGLVFNSIPGEISKPESKYRDYPFIVLNNGPILEDGTRAHAKVLLATHPLTNEDQSIRQYCAYLPQGHSFVRFTFSGEKGQKEMELEQVISDIKEGKKGAVNSSSSNEWVDPSFGSPVTTSELENETEEIHMLSATPDDFVTALQQNARGVKPDVALAVHDLYVNPKARLHVAQSQGPHML